MATHSTDKDKPLICTSCGAPLKIDSAGQEFVTCEYCGSSFSVSDLLDENESERAARAVSKAFKKILSSAAAKHPAPKTPRCILKKEGRVSVAQILLIILITLAVVTTCASFAIGFPAGAVALIQLGLLAYAFAQGPGAGKRRAAAMALAVVLIVPWAYAAGPDSSTSSSHVYSDFDWSDAVLAEHIPPSNLTQAYVYSNTSERLSIDLANATEDDFNAYVTACRQSGYTIEPAIYTTSFEAFNEDGYKVSVNLYRSLNEMDIRMKAPKPMSAMIWPSGTVADTIPQPDSSKCYIESASATSLSIYVNDMSVSKLKEYGQACVNAGYSAVEAQNDDYLCASNSAGQTLSIRYEGNGVAAISIY